VLLRTLIRSGSC